MAHTSAELFQETAHLIAKNGRDLYQRGWSPATSSNYSMRLDTQSCAITISGRDKSVLSVDDVMVVDMEGKPLTPNKPSAETLLHTYLYQRFPYVGAILHTHSPNATVISRLLAMKTELRLANYELLKAFDSITTHQTELLVPIFENTQDIFTLAKEVDAFLLEHQDQKIFGYLIRGHGLYVWGKTMNDARRHLEAFEFLFDCELKTLAIKS